MPLFFPLDRERISVYPEMVDELRIRGKQALSLTNENGDDFAWRFLYAQFTNCEAADALAAAALPQLATRLEGGPKSRNDTRENAGWFAICINYLIEWLHEGHLDVDRSDLARCVTALDKLWLRKALDNGKREAASQDTDESANLYYASVLLDWATEGTPWATTLAAHRLVGGIVSSIDLAGTYAEVAALAPNATLRERLDIYCHCGIPTGTMYRQNELRKLLIFLRAAHAVGQLEHFPVPYEFAKRTLATFPHWFTHDGLEVIEWGDVENPGVIDRKRTGQLLALHALLDDWSDSRDPLFEAAADPIHLPDWYLASRGFLDRDPLALVKRGGDWGYDEPLGRLVAYAKNATFAVHGNRALPFHHWSQDAGFWSFRVGDVWISDTAVGYASQKKDGSPADAAFGNGVLAPGHMSPPLDREVLSVARADHGDGWQMVTFVMRCARSHYRDSYRKPPHPFVKSWERRITWLIAPRSLGFLVTVWDWFDLNTLEDEDRYTPEDRRRIKEGGGATVTQIVRTPVAPTLDDAGPDSRIVARWSVGGQSATLISASPITRPDISWRAESEEALFGDVRVPTRERGWQLRRTVPADSAVELGYCLEVVPEGAPKIVHEAMSVGRLLLRDGRTFHPWAMQLERRE